MNDRSGKEGGGASLRNVLRRELDIGLKKRVILLRKRIIPSWKLDIPLIVRNIELEKRNVPHGKRNIGLRKRIVPPFLRIIGPLHKETTLFMRDEEDDDEETDEPEGETFTVKELAKAVGVSPHVIRHYVQDRLLHPATPRGPHTRYEESHLHRMRAILALRAKGLQADGIRARLRGATEEQIRVLGGGKPAVAPPIATSAAPQGSEGAASASGAYRPEVARGRVVWEEIELCPGVSLRVRMDADTEARRVVGEIEAKYGRR